MVNSTSNDVYTLGETGDTMIYVFPEGGALMERAADGISQRLAEIQPHQRKSGDYGKAPHSVGEMLVQQGKITEAQRAVAQYDAETMGICLMEALTARGWLASDDLQD